MESLRRKPILLLLCCVLALGFVSMVLADEGEPVLGKVKLPHSTTTTTPTQGFAVPLNDECTGGIVIPDGATGVGDYPVCSAITSSVLEATPTCDTPSATDPASCLAAGQFVANTVWYEWTPSVTAFYMVIACSGSSCRPGTTTSTASDGVVVMYTSSTNDCSGTFTQVACNDDGCGAAGPSRIGPIQFNAGQKYFIMAGNWTNANCAVAGQVNRYELRIELALPPANDTCAGVEPLTLSIPTTGVMNGVTNNDYQLSGTACYNQGQIGTTAANQVAAVGRDVVYSFTPTVDGTYSVLAKNIVDANAVSAVPTVLYMADTCPTGGTPNVIATPPCIQAVNRNADNLAAPTGGAEELRCISMTAGTTYYIFVDTTVVLSGLVAAQFDIVVNPCVDERELNNTPAGANDPQGDGTPNSALAGCPAEGSIYVPGDVDFWTLGSPAVGDRLFLQVDGNGANPSASSATGVNYDLRITTPTDTIEYDDANNNSRQGGLCPNVAGTPMPGGPVYARVTLNSTTLTAEPYRIYHTIRPSGTGPLGTSAVEEDPEPGGFMVGDYWYGTAGNINGDGVSDIDFFYFCAKRGDQIFVSLDADPARDNTPFYTGLFLFSAAGSQQYGQADTFAQGGTSSTATTTGNLAATTPFSPAQGINMNAIDTGLWAVAVNGQAPATGQPPSVGDYLVQMSLNCAVPAADLELVKTGPTEVVAGNTVTYHLTLTNHGPNAAAYPAYLADLIPAGTELVDLSAPPEFDCFYDAGELDCIELATGCFEGTAEFTVTVYVPQCFGAGPITNLAIAGSNTGDPNLDNNLAAWDVMVLDDGTCEDGLYCTVSDYCVSGACVSGPARDCNDGNQCTDDYCDEDADMCVSVVDDTNTCTDGNACTLHDYCQGGMCMGDTPPNCNDGNACTNDSCDPAIGCVNDCNHMCDQKGYGYWKRLCRGPHPSGEFISMNDVDCVNNTCTFGSVASPADICAELNQFTHSDKCEQAEAHFMTLLLNVCRCRVSGTQMIDSHCGGNNVVGQIVPAIDAVLCDPARDHSACVSAICSANQINDGSSLWANSLRVERVGNDVKLTWTAPYASPDSLSGSQPTGFRVYRRYNSESAMNQIGQVGGTTMQFVDNNAAGDAVQYEVIAIW